MLGFDFCIRVIWFPQILNTKLLRGSLASEGPEPLL
jgi:hypothetical protein